MAEQVQYLIETQLPNHQKHYYNSIAFPSVLSPNPTTLAPPPPPPNSLSAFTKAIKSQKPFLDSLLLKAGAILFRGFPVQTAKCHAPRAKGRQGRATGAKGGHRDARVRTSGQRGACQEVPDALRQDFRKGAQSAAHHGRQCKATCRDRGASARGTPVEQRGSTGAQGSARGSARERQAPDEARGGARGRKAPCARVGARARAQCAHQQRTMRGRVLEASGRMPRVPRSVLHRLCLSFLDVLELVKSVECSRVSKRVR